MKRFVLILLVLASLNLSAQDSLKDSTQSSKEVYKNKSLLKGNSWYFAGSYSFSRNDDIILNFGRTHGRRLIGCGGIIPSLTSWGIGYGRTTQREENHLINAFVETSAFFIARLDYIYLTPSFQHYLRPSIGISFTHFDILYNYSIQLNRSEQNQFKHGLTLRLKIFNKKDHWDIGNKTFLDAQRNGFN